MTNIAGIEMIGKNPPLFEIGFANVVLTQPALINSKIEYIKKKKQGKNKIVFVIFSFLETLSKILIVVQLSD